MNPISRYVAASLLALYVAAAPSSTLAGVSISIALAPPPLPVYVLPPLPGPNYIWAPGYWAYADDDYYWVPGTWVLAPRVGYLWTPGYWGWGEGFYVWHAGYWGPHIGYYGGICYGHGYFGAGYEGGRWDHGNFFYNTAVTHVNTTVIHNTYVNNVVVNKTVNDVSFNGGNGGTTAQPTPQETSAMHEQHLEATTQQTQHEHAASTNPGLFAKANHGKPVIAATAKAGTFTGSGLVATKGLKISNTASTTNASLTTGAIAPTGVAKMHKVAPGANVHANVLKTDAAHRRPPHTQAKPRPGQQKQNG